MERRYITADLEAELIRLIDARESEGASEVETRAEILSVMNDVFEMPKDE